MANCNVTCKVTGPSAENDGQCIVGMNLFATNAPQLIVDQYVTIVKEALATISKPPCTLEITGEADGTGPINITQPVSIAQASTFEATAFEGLKNQALKNNS